jgi:ADP-ribosylglycohydrolase
VYIILKYADSYEDAVKANAMVGGDNASRAIAIGMVLGAYHGVEGIPPELLVGLNAFEKCDKLLRELPVVKSLLDKEL